MKHQNLITMKNAHQRTPRQLRDAEFKWAPGAKPVQSSTGRAFELCGLFIAGFAVAIAVGVAFGKFLGVL